MSEILEVEARKRATHPDFAGRYQVDVVCDNCGYEQLAAIEKGVSVVAALAGCICLRCEVKTLSRKVTR
jgi:hypothetical protein